MSYRTRRRLVYGLYYTWIPVQVGAVVLVLLTRTRGRDGATSLSDTLSVCTFIPSDVCATYESIRGTTEGE